MKRWIRVFIISGFAFAAVFLVVIQFFQTRRTVSINDKVKAQRAELGLPEVPPTVLANDKAKKDLDAIFEATGFAALIG